MADHLAKEKLRIASISEKIQTNIDNLDGLQEEMEEIGNSRHIDFADFIEPSASNFPSQSPAKYPQSMEEFFKAMEENVSNPPSVIEDSQPHYMKDQPSDLSELIK